MTIRALLVATCLAAAMVTAPVTVFTQSAAGPRTFATPEEAVQALSAAARDSSIEQLLSLFTPYGRDLGASSDPATAKTNRDVFIAAFTEAWHLTDDAPNRKTLVIGNEEWPFPVPIVKVGSRWQFDAAAGKEEVLARRIGRNELQAIAISHTYVAAQHQYASDGHDGKPSGLYAQVFASDSGRHNGLSWPDVHGDKRSPLGDLVAKAAAEGQPLGRKTPGPSPFYGYYFKILKAQGKHAAGGAKSYIANGEMSGGFALVAWPAQYDVTGIMTFVVNQDGTIRQKDLGAKTDEIARAMTVYDPDASWAVVQER